jgi:catechol 2,3-dioxygenase-like lactoylglutathione lyase family enzyme
VIALTPNGTVRSSRNDLSDNAWSRVPARIELADDLGPESAGQSRGLGLAAGPSRGPAEVRVAITSVRYIVADLEPALDFYTRHLGFSVELHPAPTFAMLRRGELRLLLSVPSGQGGGGQVLADGSRPEPGGWNRFQLEVADLAGMVGTLRRAGVRFRGERIVGVGGAQALLEDPSGNLVELFESAHRSQ